MFLLKHSELAEHPAENKITKHPRVPQVFF